MLLHKLVQNGDGVQVPADHLAALGVQTPGPDFSVLPQNQLVGQAVLQHVGVVVGVVVGEDQGLFALGKVEGVAHHHRIAGLIDALAPHVPDVHQDVALLIDVVQNPVELVHRHHVVVQAVRLGVAVEGQLRVGDDGVEEEVLHNAVVGGVGHPVPLAALGHDGGVQNLIGRGGRHLRLRGRLGLLRQGVGLCGQAGLLRLDGVRRVCLGRLAGAGAGKQQRQGQQQGNGSFHVAFIPPEAALRRSFVSVRFPIASFRIRDKKGGENKACRARRRTRADARQGRQRSHARFVPSNFCLEF